MIIDVHAHVMPEEMIRARSNIALCGKHFPSYGRLTTAHDLIAAMNENGVEKSWICGYASGDIGLCREQNDYVLEACASHNGRLQPLCVVPPLDRGAAGEVLRCAEGGAIGVGELLPDEQEWCVSDIRETWRLVATCHESSLFMMLRPSVSGAGPRELLELARNHPELKMIVSDLGGGLFMQEYSECAAVDLQNVWYSTASALLSYGCGILKYAMSTAPEKTLYGSGFPLEEYREHWAIIEKKLNERELSALTRENAARLLAS